MLKVLLPKDIDWSKVDIWSQDETRIGQQGSLSRIWAKRGIVFLLILYFLLISVIAILAFTSFITLVLRS